MAEEGMDLGAYNTLTRIHALKEEPKKQPKKSRPDVMDHLSTARSFHADRRAVQAKFLDTEVQRVAGQRVLRNEYTQAVDEGFEQFLTREERQEWVEFNNNLDMSLQGLEGQTLQKAIEAKKQARHVAEHALDDDEDPITSIMKGLSMSKSFTEKLTKVTRAVSGKERKSVVPETTPNEGGNKSRPTTGKSSSKKGSSSRPTTGKGDRTSRPQLTFAPQSVADDGSISDDDSKSTGGGNHLVRFGPSANGSMTEASGGGPPNLGRKSLDKNSSSRAASAKRVRHPSFHDTTAMSPSGSQAHLAIEVDRVGSGPVTYAVAAALNSPGGTSISEPLPIASQSGAASNAARYGRRSGVPGGTDTGSFSGMVPPGLMSPISGGGGAVQQGGVLSSTGRDFSQSQSFAASRLTGFSASGGGAYGAGPGGGVTFADPPPSARAVVAAIEAQAEQARAKFQRLASGKKSDKDKEARSAYSFNGTLGGSGGGAGGPYGAGARAASHTNIPASGSDVFSMAHSLPSHSITGQHRALLTKGGPPTLPKLGSGAFGIAGGGDSVDSFLMSAAASSLNSVSASGTLSRAQSGVPLSSAPLSPGGHSASGGLGYGALLKGGVSSGTAGRRGSVDTSAHMRSSMSNMYR